MNYFTAQEDATTECESLNESQSESPNQRWLSDRLLQRNLFSVQMNEESDSSHPSTHGGSQFDGDGVGFGPRVAAQAGARLGQFAGSWGALGGRVLGQVLG